MSTAFGKLTLLALVLALGIMLFAPMRSGEEDKLTASVDQVTLDPGETAEVTYSLESETAQTVSYQSDDASIASVDQQGIITAISPGTTKVRLTAQSGATAVVSVVVSGVAITSISLNTDLLELDKGDVSGLSCEFNTGATEQTVTWTSGDTSVVRVDSAGRVSAVGGGETYVTATLASGLSASALVRVNVVTTAVQIVPGDMVVGVGTSFQFQTHFIPEDATDSIVSWTSSNSQVLSVDSTGLMYALSVGSAVVTVRTEQGITGSTEVVVEKASQDFQISASTLTIERGDSHTLVASFIGEDGLPDESVDHYVKWTSSDTSVVTVSDGVVTGIASGSAVITAVADGFTASCSIEVQTTVKEIELNLTEVYLLRSETDQAIQLEATLTPSDADNLKVTYTTNNALVANVDSNGLVTLTGGYGTAVITASTESGAEATFTVNVVTQLPGTESEDSESEDSESDEEDEGAETEEVSDTEEE